MKSNKEALLQAQVIRNFLSRALELSERFDATIYIGRNSGLREKIRSVGQFSVQVDPDCTLHNRARAVRT